MRAWVRMLGLIIAAFALLAAGAVVGVSSSGETLDQLLAAALLLAAVGVMRAAAPK